MVFPKQGVAEGTLLWSLHDPFEMPHVQLALKRSKFRLGKERLDQIDDLLWIVDHDRLPVVHPRYDMFQTFLLNMLHHVVKFPRKLQLGTSCPTRRRMVAAAGAATAAAAAAGTTVTTTACASHGLWPSCGTVHCPGVLGYSFRVVTKRQLVSVELLIQFYAMNSSRVYDQIFEATSRV